MVTRAVRLSHWLLCCLLIFGDVSPAAMRPAGAQSQDVPGLRGSLYQSPAFGYTMLVHPATWTVDHSSSKGGHDLIELSNETTSVRVEGYGLPSGAAADPYASCVEARRDEVVTVMDPVRPVRQVYPADNAPITGYIGDVEAVAMASWELTFETGPPLLVFVECLAYLPSEPSATPDFILETTVTTSMEQVGEAGDWWSLPEEVRELSVAPPASDWDPANPESGRNPGFLEFEFALGNVTRLWDGEFVRPVVIYVTNVDGHRIEFDAARFRLESIDGERSEPLRYTVVHAQEAGTAPSIALEPGEWATIFYEFTGTGAARGICYLNSQECVQILICVFDEYCAVGSRPRLQIGR